MSGRDIARRAAVEVSFAGVNITRSIRPYLLSLTYTDNEEDETDDLQIRLQDREAIWTESWLDELIKATAASRMKIDAVIATRNWNGDGGDVVLPCGVFELDSVSAEGPPSTVTIKATALPFSASIRQTKKNRVWEAYYLSGIANQMCSEAGMTCMYLSDDDPYFEREEQVKTSDIAFLSELCHNSGISLKVTNNIVVLFDQRDYESRPEVMTITRGDGSYTRHSIGTSAAETQYASCRVSYVDPRNGQCIEGIAKTEDYNDDATDNQQLEISARVASVAGAACRKTAASAQQVFTDVFLYASGEPGIGRGRDRAPGALGRLERKVYYQAGHALRIRQRRLYHTDKSTPGIGGILMANAPLENIVREGTVTAVDADTRRARVKFQDLNIISDWLPVLSTPPFIPDYEGEQRTEYESGGSEEAAFASHKHDLIIKPWLPSVNDTVLVVYLPLRSADGFVLGRIDPW